MSSDGGMHPMHPRGFGPGVIWHGTELWNGCAFSGDCQGQGSVVEITMAQKTPPICLTKTSLHGDRTMVLE